MQVHTTLSLRYRVIQQLPILRRLPGFPAARVRAGLVPATMRHTWPPGQQGQGIDLFMKKLTRDRVVPISSARVSCVIFGIKLSGSPGFPNSAIKRRILAKRFSLELKS